MPTRHLVILLFGGAFLVGCSKELPPRSVQEFLDDPILLEASVVRCAQNRSESRYNAECVNARQAVAIIEAREERERADLLEAQSERKRQALRRTQEAAAEARRRAESAERLRREAEYLAQFGELPPPTDGESDQGDSSHHVPGAVVSDEAPVEAGANAPQVETQPSPSDLSEIREALRQAGEGSPD